MKPNRKMDKNLNRQFMEEEIGMTSTYERYFFSQVIMD